MRTIRTAVRILAERADMHDRQMFRPAALGVALIFLVALMPALISTNASAIEPDAVTPQMRAEVIEEAIALLEELYVIPETADRVAAMLRENLAAGKYDGEMSTRTFAAALTRDMFDLTNDKHLRGAEAEST